MSILRLCLGVVTPVGCRRVSIDLVALLAVLAFGVLGCVTTRGEQADSMLLQPGDSVLGRRTFIQFQCGSCHEVTGDPAASSARRIAGAPTLVRGRPDYAAIDWARAIVEPTHDTALRELYQAGHLNFAEMPEFADELSVQQLRDLVAFLGDRSP